MTLVLSVRSRNSFWVVVDRRLSYGRGRRPVDTAVKIMHLETLDGVALLAYAGLGATPRGTEPSVWMSALLRGRGGLTLEQALGVVAATSTTELPRYLVRIPGGSHFIVVAAFIRAVGPRLYSIDNVIDPRSRRHVYRYTRHERTAVPGAPPPRIALAGTGGMYLAGKRGWQRPLLKLINAHDRGKVSDLVVADELARLNNEAHEKLKDGTVGPHSIVVWRRRAEGAPPLPGGGHQSYTGTDRDSTSVSIPSIMNGMDVQALAELVMAQVQERLAGGFDLSAFAIDADEMNMGLSELPSDPDDRLR